MNAGFKSLAQIIALGLLVSTSSSWASVVVSGTRVIYPAKEREVTVQVTNTSTYPELVQTWLDDGDPHSLPSDSKAPFTITPPMFRIGSKRGQSLRVMYTHEALPADKESVFWLNVLEVPPRHKVDTSDQAARNQNSLQFAFRTRIKLFFRPEGLAGSAFKAPEKVTWRFVEKQGHYELEASNPTPYHITFNSVDVTVAGTRMHNDAGGMVDPGGTEDFNVGDLKTAPAAPSQVDYTFFNDYGAVTKGSWAAEKQ